MCSINFKLPDQLLNLFCYQNCLYIAYMNNMIKKKQKTTCDDDDGSAENVGEDEDVYVLQRVKLEAVASRDWRRHLYNLVPLLLPVLGQQP